MTVSARGQRQRRTMRVLTGAAGARARAAAYVRLMNVNCNPNLTGGVNLKFLGITGVPNPDNLWLKFWVWNEIDGWVQGNWIGPYYAEAGALSQYAYPVGASLFWLGYKNVWHYLMWESYHQSFGPVGAVEQAFAEDDDVLSERQGPWCKTSF